MILSKECSLTARLWLTYLRHLASIFFTMDGNHHANRYVKNTDPRDVSLLSGSSYMPVKSVYKKYLEGIESAKEVSTHFLS